MVALSQARTSTKSNRRGRKDGKGVGPARDLARRVRKIAISDRLTPREISAFLQLRGKERNSCLLLMGMEKIRC